MVPYEPTSVNSVSGNIDAMSTTNVVRIITPGVGTESTTTSLG